jgi:Domain of unknown function (DUF4372)
MYQGRFVFSQFLQHLPWRTFRRLVRKYDGERYAKCFSCVDQFLCMAFAQLTGRESLRDIEVCLRAHQTKWFHLDLMHLSTGRCVRDLVWGGGGLKPALQGRGARISDSQNDCGPVSGAAALLLVA